MLYQAIFWLISVKGGKRCFKFQAQTLPVFDTL